MPRFHFQYITAFLVALLAPALPLTASAAGGENPILVTTVNDLLNPADGLCSLREAIHNARTNTAFGVQPGECPAGSATATDVIVLQSGQVYTLTRAGSGNDEGDLDVFDDPATVDLRIRSSIPGSRATIRQLVAGERVLQIHSARVELDDLVIRGGQVTDFGGGIASGSGHLTLRNVQVFDNQAVLGGGIYASGFLSLENSEVHFNRASMEGGGVMHIATIGNEPSLIISGGSVTENEAAAGAGVYHENAWVSLLGQVEFIENTATGGDGGGVLALGGYTQASQAHFFRNKASSNGGAIAIVGIETESEFGDMIMHGNQAHRGGALYQSPDANHPLIVVDSDFEENSASDRGGALYGRNVFSNRSEFRENAASLGGAIYSTGGAGFRDSRASGNRANFNGGAIRSSRLNSERSTFDHNLAIQGDGGALWVETAIDVLHDSVVRDNTAGRHGGGVYLHGTASPVGTSLRSSAIARNTAAGEGGGLWLRSGGMVRLRNTTISGNKAGTGGGVYLDESTTMDAVHITLSFNPIGQDLYKMGTLILGNSILGTPGVPSCTVSLDNFLIQSLGHNLSTDPLCFGLDQPGDQLVADPLLLPLADNGGDTLSHAMEVGSPALNAADLDMCMSFAQGNGQDQRRGERPVDGACDVGAFEQGAIFDRIFANGFSGPSS